MAQDGHLSMHQVRTRELLLAPHYTQRCSHTTHRHIHTHTPALQAGTCHAGVYAGAFHSNDTLYSRTPAHGGPAAQHTGKPGACWIGTYVLSTPALVCTAGYNAAILQAQTTPVSLPAHSPAKWMAILRVGLSQETLTCRSTRRPLQWWLAS